MEKAPRGSSVDERLEHYSIPVPECGCRLWLGAVDTGGYARLTVNRKVVVVSRFILERKEGPLPEGVWALHTCDIPSCIEENHIFAGTVRDNHDDMVKKGRSAYGERHAMNRLSTEQAMAIKASKASLKEISELYGVSQSHISGIRHGAKWKHLS